MLAIKNEIHKTIDSFDETKLLQLFAYTKFIAQQPMNELWLYDEEENELIAALESDELMDIADVKKQLGID